ncbi:magnesium-dependent phosphatase 1-like isoform X2 [Panicum virgatum]|uniref:magnesium-dependent phosphatase 1-like isoform X2 n=1 Tax=Panicum virgatum TaxID=38727 RepID=UPI0019D53E1A|nr:magnesium-dependent phosphatase 1-like isoform X2 [Panicum virgatum]
MGDERVKAEALQILGLFQVLPRLVVFDLDYTLWPFYCECRSKRDSPSLFRHARGIMHALKEKGIDMAIASRSPTPDIAKVFIDKLELQSMFVAQVSKMGVTSVLVENGVNLDMFKLGLNNFATNFAASSRKQDE